MRARRRGSRLCFLAGSVAAGGGLLVLLVVDPGSSVRWSPDLATSLLFWIAFIALSEVSPVPLPGSRASASLTPVAELAAIPVFGPVAACLAGLIARVVAHAVRRSASFIDVITDLAGAVLAISVAGLAFQELGGLGAGGWSPGPGQLTPMLGAAGAYLAVRNGLRLLAGTILEGRAFKDHWQARVRREAIHELLLLPFAALLAVTQVRHGRVGLSFLFLSLLVAHYVYRNWRDTRRAHLGTVRALMAAVDAADPFSRGHAERVSRLALQMARHLGVPRRDHEEIEYGALLHDIGRTAIENEVLLKPGRLSSGERAMMQTHPRIGYEILKGLQLIEGAADLVHAHHEQPDGRGYPRGLAGEQIPVGARIIMVAAAFDAMTADRPYRRGLSAEAACEELRRHSGTQFFPEMVEALIELHTAGRLPDSAVPGTVLDTCRRFDRPLSESLLAETGAGLPVADATAIEVPGDLAARMEGEERRAG